MGISQQEQEKYFDQEYEKFMAIPDDETIALRIPPEEAVAEVTRMESVVEQDKQELLDADVEQELIDSYRPRAGAFIYSVVRSQTFTSDALSRNDNWVQTKKEAVDLRKDLGHHFKRAFRNDPKLLETVDRILEGRGDRNLALEILTLSKLGKENKPLLERIKKFKFEWLDRAAELYVILSDLLASIEIDPDEGAEVAIVVNKAWTYLKKALDEIYDGGKYAFPEGTERHELYYNDYYKRIGTLGGKQRAKASTEAVAVADETPEEQPVSV